MIRPATFRIRELSANASSSAIRPRSDAVEEDHPDHAREQQGEAWIHDRQWSEVGFDPDRGEQYASNRCERNARDRADQPRWKIRARDIDHRVAADKEERRKRQRGERKPP